MRKLRNILLPTDFSETCTAARDHAAVIAARSDARLHVLHVQVLHGDQYAWAGVPSVADYEAQIAEAARDRVETFAAPLQGRILQAGERDITAAPGILRYAESHDIDLIVMGNSARRGAARWFLGNEAAVVARDARCPVLMVGRDQAPDPGPLRHILAAVDFSESSVLALQQAAEVAAHSGARLVALHVVDESSLPPYYRVEFAEGERERAREALERLLNETGLPVPAEAMVAAGRPFTKIVEIARDIHADWIVMGLAGLSGYQRFLLGSTTERVLRTAPCPVLAHRGAELISLP